MRPPSEPRSSTPSPRALRNLPVPPVMAPVLTVPGTSFSVPSVVMLPSGSDVFIKQPNRARAGR
jgi:hypothetical protein